MILIKRGVCKWGRFARRALEREQADCGWWPFSFEMLAELDRVPEQFLDALLVRLYRSLPGGDGITKRTYPNRFPEIDDAIVEWLCARRQNAGCSIHDMAASSGISTLPLFRKIKPFLRTVEVLASDPYSSLIIIEIEGTKWKAMYDIHGRCLQLVGWGFVLSGQQLSPIRYLGNRIVQQVVLHYVEPKLRQALNEWQLSRKVPAGVRIEQIHMFHPDCFRLAESDPGFRLGQDDIMAPADAQWTVVRAMNILTGRHFELGRLDAALRAVARRVEDGGILVLGRNIDEDNGRASGTIIERDGTSWRIVKRIRRGYDHEDLFFRAVSREYPDAKPV